jgi:hypothetical protein
LHLFKSATAYGKDRICHWQSAPHRTNSAEKNRGASHLTAAGNRPYPENPETSRQQPESVPRKPLLSKLDKDATDLIGCMALKREHPALRTVCQSGQHEGQKASGRSGSHSGTNRT